MKREWISRWRMFLGWVGALDAGSGVALVLWPVGITRLVGIDVPPDGAIYLRFVGTFVLALGLGYLRAAQARQLGALISFLETTSIMRVATAVFCAVAVSTGALPAPWLTVVVADVVIALVQGVLRREGSRDA